MFQATGSDAGKSLVVAALCRAFSNRGINVLPFKPQNMSNNAAVTRCGAEIGRAQYLQALACRAEPVVAMNPVLLKPESEKGSQVILDGKVYGRYDAMAYQELRPHLLSSVCKAFDKLKKQADLILVEGAGSAGEINLRAGDIANMGFARHNNVPVILIGDIDRGGVIASLVGMKHVLSTNDLLQVKGYLINKFRGDIRLFDKGLELITQKTSWKNLGVLPYIQQASLLPAEDSTSLSDSIQNNRNIERDPSKKSLHIVVPELPRIANFDDLDPLRLTKGVNVTIGKAGKALPESDLIILPGSKSTIADLKFVYAQGWHIDIQAHVRRGKKVLGICAGYQMLGKKISDPYGLEGNVNESCEGLGLLNVETIFDRDKTVRQRQFHLSDGHNVVGYEIHMGRTFGKDCERPFLVCENKDAACGATSENGNVSGLYVHGLFSDDKFRQNFLQRLSADFAGESYDYNRKIDSILDEIAKTCEQHICLDTLLSIACN